MEGVWGNPEVPPATTVALLASARSRKPRTRSRCAPEITGPIELWDPLYGHVFLRTLGLAAFGTAATLVGGFPLAYYLARYARVVALIVRARFVGMGRELEEASYDLGAGPIATFRQVTLPRLAPAINATAAMMLVPTLVAIVVAYVVLRRSGRVRK